jgi:CheY-like chemotaxis protein
VISKNTGSEALDYLRSIKDESEHPDLILLDINMPGMNGWEFLEEYERLDKRSQGKIVIIMLTTSDNIDDLERAKKWSFVSDYITKPLTKETMKEISNKYF